MNNGIMKYRWREMAHTAQQNKKKKKFLNYYHAEKSHTILREANERVSECARELTPCDRVPVYRSFSFHFSHLIEWRGQSPPYGHCFLRFCRSDGLDRFFLLLLLLLLLYWCACGAYLWLCWFVDRERDLSAPVSMRWMCIKWRQFYWKLLRIFEANFI